MLKQYEEELTVLFKNDNYSILEGTIQINNSVRKNIYLSLNGSDKKLYIDSLTSDKDNNIQDRLEYNDLALAILRNENIYKNKCQAVIKIFVISTLSSVIGTQYQMEDMYNILFGENFKQAENPKVKTYYL